MRPPHLRTVILTLNLMILLLPLGSIGVLRLYENELVRRTEAELIAQGAFVAAQYRQGVLNHPELPSRTDYGVAADPRYLAPPDPESDLRPVPPSIDRARAHVAGPAPNSLAVGTPDPIAADVGSDLLPILADIKNVTLAGIRVVDFQGVEVSATRFHDTVDLTSWSEVPRALRGEVVSHLRERVSDEPAPPFSSRSRRTRVRVFVAMPIVIEDRVVGAVVLSRTPMSLGKALYLNQRTMLTAAFLLLGLVVLLSLVASVTLARPLRALVEQAKAVASGRSRAVTPLVSPGTQELAELSTAISVMASTLAAREAYLRDFARGLSHEFKTPLTSIRGSVELLRDHFDTMSADEVAAFLQTLELQGARLTVLVSRVLELARADVLAPGTSLCVPRVVIEQLIATTEESSRIALRLSDTASVPIAEDVLETVVETLISNALRHGGPNVSVRLASRGDDVDIVVWDDGPEISEANVARLFEAFFTTARDSGGTGLGLSIARSLVEAHGGALTYAREDDGTALTVTFPGVSS